MGRIIGIDLGTTNTVVAVMEGERARVLEDDRGNRLMPSIVGTKGNGTIVFGSAAANLILTRPDRVVYAAKRFMGRRFDSSEVQDSLRRVTFGVRAAGDGTVELQFGDEWVRPEVIAARMLEQARTLAERTLGEPVTEAVITVPAYFNHAQRSATLAAARTAGLRCDRLLNEPTAAALAYGHRKSKDARVVIFDLGGGTFDVSVLHIRDGVYEILATAGDTFLGGEDFDHRIAEHLAARVESKHGVNLREDAGAMRRLKEAGERAKRDLAARETTEVDVPHLAPKVSLLATLQRSEVEAFTAELIARAEGVVRGAIEAAGLVPERVDDVVLVGGMTRWPAVRASVRALFGREPSLGVHPDEVVAIGAAVHASSLENGAGPRAVLLDVTPFDLGIDSVSGTFATIIPRNSRVPCSESRTFSTAADEQTSVKITIRQGEHRVAAENEFLGEFVFDGLAALPRMQAKVAVTFRIDKNGMLQVTAMEPASGERRQMTIRNYAEVARGEASADVEGDTTQRGGEASLGAATTPATTSNPSNAVAPAAPRPDDAVTRKVGFLDSLFGRSGGARAASPTSPPPAVVTPTVMETRVAGAAPVVVAPLVADTSLPAGPPVWVPVAPARTPITAGVTLVEVNEDDLLAFGGETLAEIDEFHEIDEIDDVVDDMVENLPPEDYLRGVDEDVSDAPTNIEPLAWAVVDDREIDVDAIMFGNDMAPVLFEVACAGLDGFRGMLRAHVEEGAAWLPWTSDAKVGASCAVTLTAGATGAEFALPGTITAIEGVRVRVAYTLDIARRADADALLGAL